MLDLNTERRNYQVGYGKPPLHTRFKKGERRNPRGRPRRNKALTEIFKKVIDEKVTIPVGDTSERITRGQAVLLANLEQALKGNQSAGANVYELINEVGMLTEIPESKRAYFFVPKKVSEEEFEREGEEVNRKAVEEARHRRERGEDLL